jgi:hypothetical protein
LDFRQFLTQSNYGGRKSVAAEPPPEVTTILALKRPARWTGARERSSSSWGSLGEHDQMSLLRIDDTDIAFERLGCAGPVIIFESGLGTDMHGWEEVAG